MLTLMWLRLVISGQNLGYQYGLHSSAVSCIFASVLEVLHARLKFMIVWPEREILRESLSVDFKKHSPDCVVIIDCFEIFTERPSGLLARAQLYSSYKHHNIIKYLIHLIPHGTVSFISDGWGSRVSGNHITENSNFLNDALPGDPIPADRGFYSGFYRTRPCHCLSSSLYMWNQTMFRD